jgi:uracil-DNA glycosylase
VRMINPEILVPVGERALAELGAEYTTKPADGLDIAELHATTVRGRGFELVPMVHPSEQSEAQTDEWIEFFLDLQGQDYRQTKGRRER